METIRELSVALREEGNLYKAEKLGKQTLKSSQRNLGLADDRTWYAVYGLARTLCRRGRLQEAIKVSGFILLKFEDVSAVMVTSSSGKSYVQKLIYFAERMYR